MALQELGLGRRISPPIAPVVIKYLATLTGLGSTVSVHELRSPLPFTEDLEERLLHIYAALAARRASILAVGPAWLALIFVAAWTSASLLLWAVTPTAFTLTQTDGIKLGDFIYFVINSVLVNVPADIYASSRLAHALFAAIILSGAVVVVKYALAIWTDPKSRFSSAEKEVKDEEKQLNDEINKSVDDLQARWQQVPRSNQPEA
jgi:hypothetical protein